MNIVIKDQIDIEKMKVAGKLAAEVLDFIKPHVQAGVSTLKLNDLCHNYIVNEQKAIPAPLNYKGFPKSICTSLNNVICHGIPSDKKILKDGDILNIDVTVIKDGYHGDTSKMFFVGEPSIKARNLVKITQECMYLGIKQVKPGAMLSSIGKVIQQKAENANFSVVREYCGHGIGKVFHEDPQVLHYYDPSIKDVEIQAGMIFTIEPMINLGKRHVKLKPDNWTVVTKDRSLSAQWEHTVLVTDYGFEILTKREEEGSLT